MIRVIKNFHWVGMLLVTAAFFAVLLNLVSSCSKETVGMKQGVSRMKTFRLGLKGTQDTKVYVSASGLVTWKAGDEIFYVTGRTGSISGVSKYVVKAVEDNADEVTCDINYRDGDKSVLFFALGKGVSKKSDGSSSYGSPTFSSLAIANGVPASQNGVLENYHIGVKKADFNNLDAELSSLQSFVRFSMSDLSFGGLTVNKIEITGGAGTEGICGSMSISNPGTGAMELSYTETGKKITIDKTKDPFVPGTEYFVAVKGGLGSGTTYGNGLKFTLYNVDGGTTTTLCTIYPKSSITLKAGDILNFGDLQSHKLVETSSVKIYPGDVTISKDMGQKKIWLVVTPYDFTGKVKWTCTGDLFSVSPSEMTGISDLTSSVKINGVDVPCFEAVVDASGASVGNWTTVSAEVIEPGKESGVKYNCKVTLDDFVDLGISDGVHKILWARSNLVGSAGSGIGLSANDYDYGGYYPFGFIDDRKDEDCNTYMSPRWAAAKYTNATQLLENADNASYQANSAWTNPSIGEYNVLWGQKKTAETKGGNAGVTINGTEIGYTDCWIFVPFGGQKKGTTFEDRGSVFIAVGIKASGTGAQDSFRGYVNSSGGGSEIRTPGRSIRPIKKI